MAATTIRARTGALLLLGLAGAGLAAAALLVHFGVYDTSATSEHTRPVYALMDYALLRSVQVRSDEIKVPDLSDAQRIRRGAVHYRGHCVQCHGAPGVAPDPLAYGLNPAPANLVGTARHWRDASMFWVVRNGIKMSGMPAWASRLSDEEIWDVIAFVRASVTMTPGEYAAFAAQAPAHGQARQEAATSPAPAVPGDPEAGRRAAGRYLCATCHVIPGLVGANRHVGPPLAGVGRRGYLGGVVANTPENMVRWLKDPRALDPLSAMPAMGLTDQDARDIAAFLYTLDDISAR